MIESRGVATVVVGLVRPHMEKTKPPRGLWVPFPLGRPFGEPENPAFQRRVLMAALELLERSSGPVVLEDFPEDAPSMRDTAGWGLQVVLPPPPSPLPSHAGDWVSGLAAEIEKVRPLWEAAQHRVGRTMVGNSRLTPEAWAPFAVQFLLGEIPESPIAGLSSALVVRYVADDLKTLYAEAIGPQPSSNQINQWFWNETLAGAFLRALRTAAIASPHNGFNIAGSRFIVPGTWVKQE